VIAKTDISAWLALGAHLGVLSARFHQCKSYFAWVSGKVKMKFAKFRLFVCRFVLICPKPAATNPAG
jgi:hypothetical protein